MTLIKQEDAIEEIESAMKYDESNVLIAGLACAKGMITSLPSAETEWIPCSERLPKTGDDILVTFSDGEVDIIISARPKAWVKYEEANNLIFPVAWMPLPEPYREESEVEE